MRLASAPMSEYLERLAELKAVRAKATAGKVYLDADFNTLIQRPDGTRVLWPFDISDAHFKVIAANEWNALIESNRVLREALEKYKGRFVLKHRMDGTCKTGHPADEALTAADALLLGKGRE